MRYITQYDKETGRTKSLHRIVWESVHGPIPSGMVIDHINGDKHDNRLENLRLCTTAQNLANAKLSSRNTSGIKGVSWNSKKSRWDAKIMADGVVFKKSSKDLFEIACWAFSTRNAVHGEFAKH